jgi:MYXO-CTERM domain-containing protein
MDDAILQTYGVTRVELENQWRETMGAADYVPPERDKLRPTPVPRRVIQPFTLTPQAGSETVATLEVTPTPIPTATVEPAPTSTPIPPPATPPPAVVKAVEPEPTAAPTPGSAGAGQDTAAQGASCNLPAHPGAGLSDLAMPAFLLGLVGLGVRRRRR